MKYYLIAGEASGDLHASNLMRELKQMDTSAQFRCWGGDLMATQGGEIVKHYRDLAFMGFAEVLLNIGTILKNLKFCKSDILDWKPDVLILVDYPGFNMRIAKFAKEKGIKVFYYISPQIWAWKESRVHQIKKTVDKMFVILPFEEAFYTKYNYKVDYVGHPLLDAVDEFEKNKPSFESFVKENSLDEKPIVALLPGSRKQEVERMLDVMLRVAGNFPDYQFVIAGAPSLDTGLYKKWINNQKVALVQNKTYELLQNSRAALVTSGTATLETALFNVPEVVCYTGGKISYHIAKKLIRVKYISLVNLIMDREVVRELIQHELSADNLEAELRKLLHDPQEIRRIKKDYGLLREKLGGSGASNKAASLMMEYLKS